MSKFLPSDGGANRPGSIRLRGRQVAVGEALQIKGDSELRDQIESELDRMIRERTLEAKLKAETIVSKAQQEADAILQSAQEQAEALIQQAVGEQEGIRTAAHEAGFKAGYDEGYTEATDQVQGETVELLAGAQTILQGAYQAERRVLKTFEKQALQLVQHVASKVLHSELETAPEKILAMIDQAVESLHLSGKVRVVVSAEMLQLIRQYSAKIDKAIDEMGRFELVSDPQLDLLQLYVLSTEGSFDVSPVQQAQELLRPLEGQLTLEDVPLEAEVLSFETGDAALAPPVDLAREIFEKPTEPTREYVSLEDLMFDEADLEDDKPELG